MMIGEFHRTHPTIQIPAEWDPFDAPTAEINSPFSINGNSINSPDFNPFTAPDTFGSLHRYLPSNDPDSFDDAVSCDEFRMYDFKVRRCAQGRSHDWTECPFAHPGEKARRRDPRKYSYSGTACPEFRKGSCRKGDSCEFAHGVFECWLHPDRYRTQACKDGTGCRRRICFFAHSPEQLRVMILHSPRKNPMNSNSNSAESYDGSPMRRSFDSYLCNNALSFDSNGYMTNNTSSYDMWNNASSFGSSSPPGSPTSSSPPMSPLMNSTYGSVHELVSNMRNLQLAKALLSPRGSNLRPGFCSLPTTPTRIPAVRFEQWDSNNRGCEEEPVMERVESGRDLRTKLYARLSKENSFGRVDDDDCHVAVDPDLGWISDLVQ